MAWINLFRKPHREIQAAVSARGQSLTDDLFISLENLTEVLPSAASKLIEENGIDAEELEKALIDPEIAAHLESRKNAVLSMPWRLEGDEQLIEWLHPIFEMHYRVIVAVLWQAVIRGYSVAHVAYRQTADGRWVWEQIMDRPILLFRPIKTGQLRYFPEDGSGGSEGLEIEEFDLRYKLFYVVANRSVATPQGDGLLPRLYWLYLFRRHGWRFWGRYLERMAGGLIVAKTPSFDRQREAFAAAVNALVQSSNITISPDESVDVVTPAGSGEAYRLFIDSVNREIQKIVLGRTLSGDQATGSRAALNEDDDVRDDRAVSDLLLLLPTMQKMIDGLVSLNFPNVAAPSLVVGDNTSLFRDLADRDKVLFEAGARFKPSYFAKAYNLDPEDVDSVATRAAQNPTSTVGPTTLSATIVAADGYTPTKGMMVEAQRGLNWRREFGRGGTAVGLARARDIVNGKALSADTVKRMRSFFARHAVDKDAKGFYPSVDGYPSNGRIAWALWGGDPGQKWCNAITLPDEVEAAADCCGDGRVDAYGLQLADDDDKEPTNALTAGILEQWSDELGSSADGQVTLWAENIEQLLDTVNDLPSAADAIIGHYSRLSTDELAALIEKALTVAHLAGEYDANNENQND